MVRTATVALVLLIACSSGESNPGPYVSVAVDNHFHDIHPKDDVTIDADRTFVVRNEGRNLHNFTVVGTDVSEDIRPGEELRFAPIGDTFEPGTYGVFCKYHGPVGMDGRITVTR